MKIDALLINEKDNVVTALRNINTNENVIVRIQEKAFKLLIKDKIPFGHKFAKKDIKKGEDIYKYGEIIGRATQLISKGSYAHIHNIESLRGRGDIERNKLKNEI